MSVLIDIVGSFFIAGTIFVSLVGLSTNLTQTQFEKTEVMVTQSHTVQAARMLEYDLVKIGFHYAPPLVAIQIADSNRIKFRADLRNTGTVDMVEYYIGATSELTSTVNKRDRYLYRVENGSTIAMNIGLTALKFVYYNRDGQVTTALDSIKSINVRFAVESGERVIKPNDMAKDTLYTGAFWQKTIFPRNL